MGKHDFVTLKSRHFVQFVTIIREHFFFLLQINQISRITYIMVQRVSDTLVVLLGKSYFIRRQKCS